MIYAGLISIAGMTASTNTYIKALYDNYQNQTGIAGTSHDKGQNCFIGLLPDGWQSADHVLLEKITNDDGSDNLQALEFAIGKVLVSDSDTLIVASRELWQELFNRPLYRLWCFNYYDEQSAEADYKLIFGADATLDGRKTLATLEAEVRAQIKGMVNSI